MILVMAGKYRDVERGRPKEYLPPSPWFRSYSTSCLEGVWCDADALVGEEQEVGREARHGPFRGRRPGDEAHGAGRRRNPPAVEEDPGGERVPDGPRLQHLQRDAPWLELRAHQAALPFARVSGHHL